MCHPAEVEIRNCSLYYIQKNTILAIRCCASGAGVLAKSFPPNIQYPIFGLQSPFSWFERCIGAIDYGLHQQDLCCFKGCSREKLPRMRQAKDKNLAVSSS